MQSYWAFPIGWWSASAGWRTAGSNIATGARRKSKISRWMRRSTSCALVWAVSFGAGPVWAHRQLDPELKTVLAKAIAAGECFTAKYDAEVWYKLMEPRLRKRVKDHHERLEILRHVYCESRRVNLPSELVLAVMDVESGFDRWAISSAGAQGLMQVMPFWPQELGMKRYELLQI